MTNNKYISLLILMLAIFYSNILTAQTPYFQEIYRTNGPEKGVTIRIVINNPCLAQSQATFAAKLELSYSDGTSECVLFDSASVRNNGQLIYEEDGFSRQVGATFVFTMFIIHDPCGAPKTCTQGRPVCCIPEDIFDCCACGVWENNVFETFWFRITNSYPQLPAGDIVEIRVSSAPGRIPGFNSPIQLNFARHGCQCCTY